MVERIKFLNIITKMKDYEEMIMSKEKKVFYDMLEQSDLTDSEKERIGKEILPIFTESESHFKALSKLYKKITRSDQSDW